MRILQSTVNYTLNSPTINARTSTVFNKILNLINNSVYQRRIFFNVKNITGLVNRSCCFRDILRNIAYRFIKIFNFLFFILRRIEWFVFKFLNFCLHPSWTFNSSLPCQVPNHFPSSFTFSNKWRYIFIFLSFKVTDLFSKSDC